MKLIDYITGSRRGREANRLERETMYDPFLADAVEGYDAVYGDHAGRLADLSQRVGLRSMKPGREALRKRRRVAAFSAVAATVLAGVSVTILYIYRPHVASENRLLADNELEMAEVSRRGAEEPVVALESGMSVEASREWESVVQDSGSAEAAITQRTSPAAVENIQAAHTGGNVGEVEEEAALYDDAAEMETALRHGAESGTEVYPLQRGGAAVAKMEVHAVEDAGTEICQEQEGAVATDTYSMESDMTVGCITDHLEVKKSEVPVIENEEFTRYFNEHRNRAVGGVVVAEFRVNDKGVPSDIYIIAGISSQVNREVIALLTSGPAWEPTGTERVRIVLWYE